MALNWVKNKKSNMYQFIDATWNTVKGECPHKCSYCYMTRWGKQPELHFDKKELNTDLGTGKFIFVGSSCDMFAEDINSRWVIETLNHCLEFDKNNYFFQTKNPKAFSDYGVHISPLSDFSLCVTLETNRHYKEIMNNSPSPIERASNFSLIPWPKKYITIEPIMDFDLYKMADLINICEPIQVNIGADSGNNNLPEPPKDKLLNLIEQLEKFTKVHQKKNLSRLLK